MYNMMNGMTKKGYLLILCALVAACRSNDPVTPPDPVVPETITLRLNATMEDFSKASVDSEGNVNWQTGDKIAILLDNGTVSSLELESGAGSGTATFSGDIPPGRSFAGKAAYPWWDGAWSVSAGELVLTLPESSTWQGNNFVPTIMKATLSGETLPFKHEGAILQFTIKSIPASAAKFKFETSAGAVMGRNNFTYTFTGAASRVFHIPVQAGTLPAYTISLLSADDEVILSKSKSSTTAVSRCDFRIVTPLEVITTNNFRLISYNICDGMVADAENDYDNFVAWMQSVSPDVAVLCEAKNYSDYMEKNFDYSFTSRMAATAARWGHSYLERVNLDNYPVVITSSHAITKNLELGNTDYTKHGGLFVTVAGYNIVATHLQPTVDMDGIVGLSPEEYDAAGPLRVNELNYMLDNTLRSGTYSGRANWIVCGDFNAYAYDERNAVSPYDSQKAYAYGNVGGNRNHAYNVYPICVDAGLKDVLYNFNGSMFQPSMYHGRSRIDYIFAGTDVYSRVVRAEVVRGGFPGNYAALKDTNPSDHFPLLMDVADFAFNVLDGKTRLEDWPEENLITE